MSRSIVRSLALLVAIVASASCGEDPFETPTSPGPPVTFTEVFEGTIARNGARTHAFATQASGSVTATLKALAPDNTVSIGVALGTWNGSACQIVIAKDDAREATVVTGAVSALGNLCVRVYDAGGLTQATDYQLEVIHP